MVQTFHATSAMTLLRSFGFEELAQSFLTQHGVHRLTNLLSLDYLCRTDFDNLNLWFEQTDVVRVTYQLSVVNPA